MTAMSSERSVVSASLESTVKGAVRQICGKMGGVVNSVVLKRRDGPSSRHSTEDVGEMQRAWALDPNEIIIAVMQDTYGEGGLGSALVFYTSACRIVALQGTDARSRTRFVAPRGMQVVGLQFDDHRLVGLHLERSTGTGLGSIDAISGRTGSAVDSLQFKLRDGSVHRYGNAGGEEWGPKRLELGERILVVEQFYKGRALGGSLAFYTSNGHVIKLSGMTASVSRRFSAEAGQQICGLDFADGRLVRVQTCPEDGDLSRANFRDVVS